MASVKKIRKVSQNTRNAHLGMFLQCFNGIDLIM